ncbi:hypothetical protein BJ508DRAFT_418689 [Ascobolus immersus RN42]|uniref:Uncharacterized protein n=1 Tax=Ascobolus immersus RN42 TaxID=1160509 RepID=A0A3N4HX98_ASCIM|nr:hypothetical protein BJ508DRAFT_418689 [Ascobolus immersus RN42]
MEHPTPASPSPEQLRLLLSSLQQADNNSTATSSPPTPILTPTTTAPPSRPLSPSPDETNPLLDDPAAGLEPSAFQQHLTALRDRLQSAWNNPSEVVDVVKAYMAEHPYLTAFQVGSMLITLFPAAVCPPLFWALGFTRVGPVGGSLAALWQSSFAGAVTSSSLFSAFQGVAMGGVKGWPVVSGVIRTVAAFGGFSGTAAAAATSSGNDDAPKEGEVLFENEESAPGAGGSSGVVSSGGEAGATSA